MYMSWIMYFFSLLWAINKIRTLCDDSVPLLWVLHWILLTVVHTYLKNWRRRLYVLLCIQGLVRKPFKGEVTSWRTYTDW